MIHSPHVPKGYPVSLTIDKIEGPKTPKPDPVMESGSYSTESSYRHYRRKPDVAAWTCGAHCVIPDTSMDSLQVNSVRRAEFR